MYRNSRWFVACAWSIVIGCDGGIECCQDHSVWGVVAGVVVDGNDDPQEGVDLEAINLQRECTGFVEAGSFSSGRTDAEGEFEMVADLILRQGGRYCFDIAMTKGAEVDTTRQLELWAGGRFPPADTTDVILVAAW